MNEIFGCVRLRTSRSTGSATSRLGAPGGDRRRRLGGHAADHDHPAGRAAVGARRAARGGGDRRRLDVPPLLARHAAGAPAGHRGDHDARHDLELQLVRASSTCSPNGGPGGKTMLPSLFVYNEAFRYGNWGYAAAMGNVMVVVVGVFLILYLCGQPEGGRRSDPHRSPAPVTRPLQYLAARRRYMVFLAFPLLFLLVTAFKTHAGDRSAAIPICSRAASSGRTSATRSTRRGCGRRPGTASWSRSITMLLDDPDLAAGGLRAGPLPDEAPRRRDGLDPAQPGLPVHPHHHPAVPLMLQLPIVDWN